MTYDAILELARKLRRNQTPAERLLWFELKNRKLDGVKFLRQYPIVYDRNGKELFFFIPDFYCPLFKLAIELDGKIHLHTIEHDKNKDFVLKETGIRVLRIRNEEVRNIIAVKNKIRRYFIDGEEVK